jgi:phosphate transport system permease protein
VEASALRSPTPLPPLSARRRRADRIARAALTAVTGLALMPLALIVVYLFQRGLGAISWDFFTTDPTGSFLGNPGGDRSAILGTLEIVGLASLVAIPIGIGVAIWIVEYGGEGRLAHLVRFFVDVMTGVPTAVFGLFVYITLVVSGVGGTSFAGWKGSVALALVMLPIVARSAEVVLNLIPDGLRESALALGAPRWKVIFRVVLPTAATGLITGAMLAVARGMGETAPLLFTAPIVNATSLDLTQRVNSLPVQIFQDLKQPRADLVDRAWAAALTLVALVLLLTLIARLVQRRSRVAGAR